MIGPEALEDAAWWAAQAAQKAQQAETIAGSLAQDRFWSQARAAAQVAQAFAAVADVASMFASRNRLTKEEVTAWWAVLGGSLPYDRKETQP